MKQKKQTYYEKQQELLRQERKRQEKRLVYAGYYSRINLTQGMGLIR